jgi:hypothetical protein
LSYCSLNLQSGGFWHRGGGIGQIFVPFEEGVVVVQWGGVGERERTGIYWTKKGGRAEKMSFFAIVVDAEDTLLAVDTLLAYFLPSLRDPAEFSPNNAVVP